MLVRRQWPCLIWTQQPAVNGLSALVAQELEYPDGHTSRSIYVAMPLVSLGQHTPSEAAQHLEGAHLAIWTTTPWTVPANSAVAVNADLQYAVVRTQVHGLPTHGLLLAGFSPLIVCHAERSDAI